MVLSHNYKPLRRYVYKPLRRGKLKARNILSTLRFKSLLRDTILIKRNKKFYLITRRDSISRKLYVSGKYGDKKIELAAKLLTNLHFDFGFLINVGSNIGTTIIQFSDFGFKEGIGIEPNPKAFHLLTNNMKLNNLNGFKILNIALDSKAGVVNITNNQNLGINSVEKTFDPNVMQIQSNTLDGIIDDFEIPLKKTSTLLWMDVQGFEFEVLKGSSKYIASGCPIVLEFWPHELLKYSKTPDFEKLFAGYTGYYILSEKNPKAHQLHTLVNLFESMQGSISFTDILVV